MNIYTLSEMCPTCQTPDKELYSFLKKEVTDGNRYFAETVIDIEIIVHF